MKLSLVTQCSNQLIYIFFLLHFWSFLIPSLYLLGSCCR
jgi:hypothetical protein